MKLVVQNTFLLFLLGVTVPTIFSEWQQGVDAFTRGDYETAFKEFLPLAEEGNTNAQFLLGGMYDYGRGVPENDQEALKWYKRAAEQGFAQAQFLLGGMYDLGKGVPVDESQTLKWFTLAARQGFPPAQLGLGDLYYKGKGVPQDNIQAYMWWSISASLGNEAAQNNSRLLKDEMSRAQVRRADRLARRCLETDYTECD